MTVARWSPGTPLLIRGIAHQRVWLVQTVTVVGDSSDYLAVYLAPGAHCKLPNVIVDPQDGGTAGLETRWEVQDGANWYLLDRPWRFRHALIVMPADTYYAVFWFWSAVDWHFECRYVNFQRPYQHTPFSVDTLDLELDLVVTPDGRRRWKDEAEYEAGVRRDSISADDARAVAAARSDALRQLEANPVYREDRWRGWRPDTSWGLPALHSRWNETPADAG